MAPVGAVAKIGQSISKGTLALSYDDKFIEQKTEMERRQKPKNIKDGMKKGFASAGSSIYSGISGVFTKPLEGAREDGFKGFIKGGARGAAGLFAKTISGGIDIIAKTSEGLDNQSKNMNAPRPAIRVRRPRSFYETSKIVRPYNEFHSFWVAMVPQLRGQLEVSTLYDVFQIHEEARLVSQTPHRPAEATADQIQEKQSTIFVISKDQIIQIKSVIQLAAAHPEEGKAQQEREATKPVTATKSIEQVYATRHIDFLEIVGDDSTVLVVGFRQNQSELQEQRDGGQTNTASRTTETSIKELEMQHQAKAVANTTPFRAAVGNEFLSSSQINVLGRSPESSFLGEQASQREQYSRISQKRRARVPQGDTSQNVTLSEEEEAVTGVDWRGASCFDRSSAQLQSATSGLHHNSKISAS